MNINKITNYRFGRDDSGYIYRNWDVSGDNVYFTEGESCGTIWFKSVPEARRFILMKEDISGHDSGWCANCQNNYAFGSEEHFVYPPNACARWKERMKTDGKWHWKDTTGFYASVHEISMKAAAILHKLSAKEMELLEDYIDSGLEEVFVEGVNGAFKLRGNKICF